MNKFTFHIFSVILHFGFRSMVRVAPGSAVRYIQAEIFSALQTVYPEDSYNTTLDFIQEKFDSVREQVRNPSVKPKETI